MRYRTFGRLGWKVSDIRYGIWGLAGWNCSSDREAFTSSNCAVEIGCDFYDTAQDYGRLTVEGK